MIIMSNIKKNNMLKIITIIRDFETMACDVITMLDIYTNDLTSGVILLQKIPHYGLDCLELAEEAKCLRFLSLYSVQNIITDIWHGKIEQKRGFKAIIAVNTFTYLKFNNFYFV